MIRSATAKIVANPQVTFTEEELWQPTWFPLLRLFGKGALAVDGGRASSVGTPVHVVWWDDDPIKHERVFWPSIAQFVETAIARIDDGTIEVDRESFLDGPTVDQLAR